MAAAVNVSTAPAVSWAGEMRATLALAWPLIIAQLATIALQATDVVMLGWLGPEYLGPGSLAAAVFHPMLMFGAGVAMAVSPLIAQARGARDPRSVRRSTRQGLWAVLMISVVLTALWFNGEPLLRLFGQTDRTAALAGDYLRYAAWMIAPHLMFIVLRGLVSAHGDTRIVLRITVFGIVLNAVLDYLLIFGAFGLPRLELRGAGLATSLVHSMMFLLLLRHVLRARATRRYMILARFWRADWQRLVRIFAIGTPVGFMMLAESGLFAVAAVMMGWIGADAMAGHAVALQLAALAFMTPLGLSHATAIRVGLSYGAGDLRGAARAGWVSIAVSLVFMGAVACIFVALPGPLTGLFLDRTDPANAAALALAVQYLMVAALFQLVDGAQVTAAAALRGFGDTRVPMMIALTGYWLVGIPIGWGLAFKAGLGGVGLWLGLAAGLAFAAVFLSLRFARLTTVDGGLSAQSATPIPQIR